MNLDFLKSNIDEVSIPLIENVIELAYTQGHNSFSPLGCSGEDYLLFGKSRRQEVSLRLHSGDVKLLVTDDCGQFLFYGGFDTGMLPISFIAKQYYDVIQNVKHLLSNQTRGNSITEQDKQKMLESRICLFGH